MPEERITLSKLPKENVRTSSLCLAHINARSIKKQKFFSFQEYITNVNIDLCATAETWLKPDDDIAKVVPPQGYTFLS